MLLQVGAATVSPAATAPTPPPSDDEICGWPCQLLWWQSVGTCGTAVVLLLFCLLFDVDGMRRSLREDWTAILAVCAVANAVCYWPLLLSSGYRMTGNAFVVYGLATAAAGLGTAWPALFLSIIMINTPALRCGMSRGFLDDTGEDITVGGGGLVGFLLAIGTTIALRHGDAASGSVPGQPPPPPPPAPTEAFECTWLCHALTVLICAELAVAWIMLVVTTYFHTDEGDLPRGFTWKKVLQFMLPLTAVLLVIGGWPLFLGAESLLRGNQFVVNYLISFSVTLVAMAAVLGFVFVLDETNVDENTWGWIVLMVGGLYACGTSTFAAWLLYVFRDAEGREPPTDWSELVFWQSIALSLLGATGVTYAYLFNWWEFEARIEERRGSNTVVLLVCSLVPACYSPSDLAPWHAKVFVIVVHALLAAFLGPFMAQHIIADERAAASAML
eukprot:SAG22_NODE_4240_length_1330_cov_1.451665_1_plen_443_part_11